MKNKLISLGLALVLGVSLSACFGPTLTEIALPSEPLELATGETATLETAYIYDGETPENAQPDITYTSSDENIATVSEDGTVTGVAEGQATITATVGDLSAVQEVNVTIPVDRLTAEDFSLHLSDGTQNIPYAVTPENFSGSLTFAVADEKVATVTEDGKITPVAVGETALTIIAPNGKAVSVTVDVWDGPKSLTLSAGKTEITQGSGTQISVTDDQGNEVSAENLLWASSDDTTAVVTNGWVDMTGTGDVTITASNEHGISASIDLTGTAPAPKAATSTGNTSGGSGSNSTSAAPSVGGGSAPANNSGHGTFTIYGDGYAFDLQNNIRAEAGVGALTWDNALGDIAAARCQQIATDFSHNGAQTAENIAWGPSDSSSVIAGWQNSPGHYANMVNSGFTCGAIVHMYDGDGCNFWVAVFQ